MTDAPDTIYLDPESGSWAVTMPKSFESAVKQFLPYDRREGQSHNCVGGPGE